METAKRTERNEEWRKQVLLGPLPQDFLRIECESSGHNQQEEADRQAAYALQQMQSYAGRLTITVAQAKLIKNYGFTNMDPYVRLRVGHMVYETQTARRGGKNPHWNKVFQVFLPAGVKTMYIEVYDECSFTMDKLIAWGHVDIPSNVIEKGETYEDWYLLSGEHGELQEGSINLVLSYSLRYQRPYVGIVPQPVMMIPNANALGGVTPFTPVFTPTPVTVAPTPPVAASTLPQAEEDLKQIAEMFPNMDKDIIKSVYDSNNGNKDAVINALLQMVE